MMSVKQQIRQTVEAMKKHNLELIAVLSDAVSITDYSNLVRKGNNGGETVDVWTDAFQKAVQEHEIVRIPASDTPYYMDGSIIVPSNRRIEASDGAVIRQMEGVRVLLLRNEHTQDGTHAPISGENRDTNISIDGGRWEESWTRRLGYRQTGRYDDGDGFVGISTFMLFSNIDCVTLTNMTFANTAGFSVQTGDANDLVFENIEFDHCFADGLHLNGNSENILARDIRGEVGDDLVALNMYDWLNSSVNFGPMRNVVCENLDQYESSPYKALRIQPGIYWYDDGSSVDCAAENFIIKNVRGVRTFKMYMQTPAYKLGEEPERGAVGSGGNLFFEDIVIDLVKPLDETREQLASDPVRGSFAGFEVNANIGLVVMENIDIKLYKEQFPYGYLVAFGPKSARNGDVEVFDPYFSSTVEKLVLKDIRVNGSTAYNVSDIVHEVVFDDINADGRSTGAGHVKEIVVDR